jgi:hypothetical protein
MITMNTEPNIPESFLELRQSFSTAWIEKWTIANPFIGLLHPMLRKSGAELSDFGFNKEAANVGETYLNVALKKLNSAVRVGLDQITFVTLNPDWDMAPQLVEVFDGVSSAIQKFVTQVPDSQSLTLSFHVTAGDLDFRKKTSQLVNRELLGDAGDADFYGVSIYHGDYGSTVIDKSLRYERAAFIRMQRRFAGDLSFAEIAPILYEEEVKTLGLIGISGIV